MNKFGKIIAGTLAGIVVLGSAGTGLAYKFSPTFKEKVDNVFHIGDKKDELKKQIEELKQQLEAYKDAENTIKTLQNEKAQLQAEKVDLQKRFDENQNTIKTLQAEKTKLSEDMQNQIDELNVRIANLEKEQTDLQKRIADLEKRVSTLEIQVADLQKQVADKQTQIDKLSEKITNLWSVFENYTIYTDAEDKGETPPATEIKQSDKEALEERISQLETKVAELESTKADKTTEKQAKQEIINNYNNQKETINNNITNNNTTINNYNTTINNNENTINDYTTTIESNNTTIANNNNTINELENKENRTDEEQITLDNLKRENSDLQDDNATKQSEIERLQTEIDTARTNVENLEKTNQEQQAQVSDLERRVSELEGEVTTIDNDISNLDKSINSVNSQIIKFQNFIKNSTIIDDSGTTDPSEPTDPSNPDTPSEDFKLEYGKRYFTELADFTTSEELDNYFSTRGEYFYSKTTDLSQSGILEQIPSAYYTSGGYKLADEQNPELEKYIEFSYMFFNSEDKQKAINFMKSGLAGMGEEELAEYCNYYKVTDNYLYLEAIVSGSETSYHFGDEKRIISYARKDGIFIENKQTGEITKVCENGRNWNFDALNSIAFAFGEDKGLLAINIDTNVVQILADAGTWNRYIQEEKTITFLNSERTKQLTYNTETNEFSISDYKEDVEIKEPTIFKENGTRTVKDFNNIWLNRGAKEEATKTLLDYGYKYLGNNGTGLQQQDYVTDSSLYNNGSKMALFVYFDTSDAFTRAWNYIEQNMEEKDNCIIDYFIISDVGAYIEFSGT